MVGKQLADSGSVGQQNCVAFKIEPLEVIAIGNQDAIELDISDQSVMASHGSEE